MKVYSQSTMFICKTVRVEKFFYAQFYLNQAIFYISIFITGIWCSQT